MSRESPGKNIRITKYADSETIINSLRLPAGVSDEIALDLTATFISAVIYTARYFTGTEVSVPSILRLVGEALFQDRQTTIDVPEVGLTIEMTLIPDRS